MIHFDYTDRKSWARIQKKKKKKIKEVAYPKMSNLQENVSVSLKTGRISNEKKKKKEGRTG